MMSRAWTTKFLAAATSMAAALCVAASASAALIVNDTWQDADRSDPAAPTYSENGVDSDTDTDIESAWFVGGSGGAALNATQGNMQMDVNGSSASWTTFFTPDHKKVLLANDGDFVKATWTFTTGDVNASNTSQNFRLAFLETPDGTRITSDAAPNDAAFDGAAYAMFMNMGETTGRSTSFELKKRSLLTTSNLLSSSGNWSTSLGNGLGNALPGYADNTEYTFTISATRNASDGLDLVATMSGGNIGGTGLVSVSATDASPNGFGFDTFSLRPSNDTTTATEFNASLFSVETNARVVPEPATLALLGLGSLLIAGLRRRH
jgi:PEP-CTERM motif